MVAVVFLSNSPPKKLVNLTFWFITRLASLKYFHVYIQVLRG